MERNSQDPLPPLQRLRPGLGILRRLVHDPAGADRVVPGSVREASHGGELGDEDERCRAELRRVRGVSNGCAVWGLRGESGDLLRRSLFGGEGSEGRVVCGEQCGGCGEYFCCRRRRRK
ncbi:hypothetical protein HAX54_028320 [Datura stramonium]|uniref:Uncharacterized protein n=1 Tax=Datura stramonium TaxID=4076 RepID=A0ABS8S9H3_DATST|nr:hypothetical protein [Datura stramonium]